MYVLVRLLKGYPKPLFYKIPQNLDNKNDLIGKIVQVPLKNKFTPALVLKTYQSLPEKVPFAIKEISSVKSFPNDIPFHSFIEKISNFYFTQPLHFYQRIRNFLLKPEKNKVTEDIEIFSSSEIKTSEKILLTDEQQIVTDYLEQFIEKPKYTPVLLHGVTSSGKTEIYKKLIIKCIEDNKTVILLLPEVSLSLQFQHLLQNQLPSNINIIGFHSATKNSEKKELWNCLLKNKPILIIGVHMPMILPISNLGLIIIDEEHETGFQEKKHPKINSKELAIWRAQHYNIPILLGSATPCLNSLYNVEKNNWKLFRLKKRFAGNFPKVELVFLNDKTKRRRKSFWITKELEEAINNTLHKKEQVIIYLNRRGYSFFVQCKNCGFIFQCPNCSVSLTLHSNAQGTEKLRCHYCDYQKDLEKTCPECKANEKNLLKKGIGTQQVVRIFEQIFPQAKIERADLDSASKKRSWKDTVEKFKNGEIDILIGTQLITKGYHFPKVTLVGILWADLNLNFPLFNASETTLQQLIQVAGRAGRQSNDSKVIAQTMREHSIFNHLNEESYLNFCKEELELRKIINYPPYTRLIQIELKNTDGSVLEKDTDKFCQKLHKINEQEKFGMQILGPAKPIVHKIQKMESRQIFIKTESFQKLHKIMHKIDFSVFKSSIFIVPTP